MRQRRSQLAPLLVLWLSLSLPASAVASPGDPVIQAPSAATVDDVGFDADAPRENQMELIEIPAFMPPPPPPLPQPPPEAVKTWRQQAQEDLLRLAQTVTRKVQGTTVGDYFTEEVRRREQVCGEEYVWHEKDSSEDYLYQARSPKFPARVKVLAAPQEAFLAKILAIREAKCEIWASTYIFDGNDSLTTQSLMHEMSKAIEKGVNVRFTIDSVGSIAGVFDPQNPSHSDAKTILFMAQRQDLPKNPCTGLPPTADVVLFNPALKLTNVASAIVARLIGKEVKGSTSLNVNRRSHDKILLIDPDPKLGKAVVIVGGRNWTDSYYGMPEIDGHTYQDMEVLVRDDYTRDSRVRLADTVGRHHWRLLCHKGNRWLNHLGIKNRTEEFAAGHSMLLEKSNVRQLFAKLQAEDYIKTGLKRALVKWGDEIENIRRNTSETIQNPEDRLSTPTGNPDSILDLSRELIGTARGMVRVVSPYLYLTRAERNAVKIWVLKAPRGVERNFHIVSNSTMTSDAIPAQVMVDTEVAPDLMKTVTQLPQGLLWEPRPNLKLFELGRLDGDRVGGKHFYGKLHAKYWTIDSEISYVGSSNFDPRSRNLQSEVGFFIYSRAIAQDLETTFQKDLIERSYLYDTPEWKQLKEHPNLRRKLKIEKYIESAFDWLPITKSQI